MLHPAAGQSDPLRPLEPPKPPPFPLTMHNSFLRQCFQLRFWGLIWACVGFLATGSVLGEEDRNPPEEVESPTEGDDSVRCPDCDANGRVVCPTCAGRGEIFRSCPTCRGSGQKPCPVCSKAQGATPGKIPCGFCGGKGTLGPQGRACSRCGGTGSNTCEVCLGKGTAPCRKEVFVKVCPTCRFARKVVCPTCGGSLRVGAAVLASRGKTKDLDLPVDHGKDPTGDSNATEFASAGGPPSETDIVTRFERATRRWEAVDELFGEDLTPRIERLRGEAAREQKQAKSVLADSAESEPSFKELKDFVARVETFKKRHEELRSHAGEVSRGYAAAMRQWDARSKALDTAKAWERTAVEEAWISRMNIVLNIAEKATGPFDKEDPSWIPKELAELETSWSALKPRVDKAGEAALARAAQARAEAAAAKVASVPPKVAPPKPTPNRVAPARTPRAPAEESVDREEHVAQASPPPPKKAAKTSARKDGRSAESSSPFLWVAVGFVAATAVYLSASRRRTRRQESEEEDPQTTRSSER